MTAPQTFAAAAAGAALVALGAGAMPSLHAAPPATQLKALVPAGTSTFSAAAPSATSEIGKEVRNEPGVDKEVPKSGLGATRVPADHVPAPASQSIASGNPGAAGFDGLTHADQRLAGGGNQFSTEPPDQGLCVGNGYVVEPINSAIRVYDASSGAPLTATMTNNAFFNLKPALLRTTPLVYGDFVADPRCYYDAATRRFFVTALQLGVVSTTGAYDGTSHLEIAVSANSNPTGSWNLYSVDVTNDGSSCPCFGDQPLIGADANGFYITTNSYPIFTNGFNGAQVYAMSKAGLESGTLPPVVHIVGGPLEEGISYTLQPATVPPGGRFESAAGGTEYFLSALEFTGGLDNRIAVWALSGTGTLDDTEPNVALTHAVVASEVYGMPPAAQQMDGPTPLAASFQPQEKLELVASNDDRMNQTMFAAGKLWAGLNTVLKPENGPTRAGIAWFAVTPSISGGAVHGTIAAQGYISVNNENVVFPSIAMNKSGKGAVSFSLVGPDDYPSAAYATIDLAHGVGAVHVIAPGAAPEDGFSGYHAYGEPDRVARWGDYSAATVDESGRLWLATEYIPNAPRTSLANWGTFVTQLIP